MRSPAFSMRPWVIPMTVEIHPDVKTLVDLSAKYAGMEGNVAKELGDALLKMAWDLHLSLQIPNLNVVHEPARAA